MGEDVEILEPHALLVGTSDGVAAVENTHKYILGRTWKAGFSYARVHSSRVRRSQEAEATQYLSAGR